MNQTPDFRYLMAAKNDALPQKPKFFIRTYGCQMNERDSEKMASLLMQIGYTQAAAQEEADLIVFNTCCVRESAEDKIFGHISVLKPIKAARKDLIIAVGGCMTQQAEIAAKLEKDYKYIDIVFGTANRHRLPEFLWQAGEGKRVVDISDSSDAFPEITDVPVTTREFPHKAGVNIMYGCDNFCSYCIVPYVRGREKSRPSADILSEIGQLAADGVTEIMLLGQNVNSYAGDCTFAELLARVNAIDGIKRIRFMTSHPKDFSDVLITAIANCEKVCKHVHLPLQAGSTRILKDMNRNYTKEEYLALITRLRAAVPQIAISTDIIVGYPSENEDDFAHTLDVVRQARFNAAFTFIYSKRSGTPAADREDNVPRKIANERFDRLLAELYPIMTEINQAKTAQTLPAMVEAHDDNGIYKGRADDHTLVHFTSPYPHAQGDIVPVKILTAKTFYLTGIHGNPPSERSEREGEYNGNQ